MPSTPDLIPRRVAPRIRALATQLPVVAVTGPRQSGKTTLCHALFGDRPYRNLELPDIRAFAAEDPRGFLAALPDGGVLDEVQRVPELFSYLQVDADDHREQKGRWILSGSQNFLLLEHVSQSLAGRAAITHLLPLELAEWRKAGRVADSWMEQALRGGYPALLDPAVEPREWLRAYLSTYLERDLRQISDIGNLGTFQRFLELSAGRSAQEWNASSLASDAGVSRATVDRWTSILEASFVVFRIQPVHRNVRKRIVKRGRLHFLDTGLLCRLLRIDTVEQLAQHPLRGAVFETWVVSEIHRARVHRGSSRGVGFYRDQHGVEVDAILEDDDRLRLIEAKSAATYHPDMARNLHRVSGSMSSTTAIEKIVVHGGDQRMLRSGVEVVPWSRMDLDVADM